MEIGIKTDDRLMSAVSFVRDGAVVADIGTDHGYIPIYLIKNGISPFAYASDVNVMPLEKAKSNARIYGVEDKISFHLSSGLRFVDSGEYDGQHPIDDIVICGMGGELIAGIIGESGYAAQKGVRLILQPMTMADKLRSFLAENGFNVTDEKLCTAAGKIYTVICAEYDGERRTLTEEEKILGRHNIMRGGDLFRKYACDALGKLKKKIDGLSTGGYSTEAEQKLYRDIEEIIQRSKTK